MTFIACFVIKNLKHRLTKPFSLALPTQTPSLTQPGPSPASPHRPHSRYGSSLATEPGRKTHSAKSQAERRGDHKPQMMLPLCFLGTFHVPHRHPPPEVPLEAMGWVLFALSILAANMGPVNDGLGSAGFACKADNRRSTRRWKCGSKTHSRYNKSNHYQNNP